MLSQRYMVWSCAFSIALYAGHDVYAQTYPSKPIRIVTGEPGGSSDFMSRLIAQRISPSLGQPVIVDNRSGGVIPGETVAKSQPDGYTVLYAGGPFILGPLLQGNLPYDPVNDFAAVTLANRAPNVLAVYPLLAASSVKELIALAKAKPGEFDYASTGAGGAIHLAAELFKSMADVNIVRVAYKGTAQGVTDLLSGQVQMMFPPMGAVAGHAKSGKLKILAVTSAQPSALAPGIPTVASSGLPGYESISLQGVFAPAKTPAVAIARLNREIVNTLAIPEVKQKFLEFGVESAGSSPEEFATIIKTEISKWSKVIRSAGIRVE